MPLAPPPNTGFPPQWLDWFRQVRTQITTPGGTVSFNALDFTGSNITSIVTRNHNSLQNIQGGAAADYQHLTTAQVGLVTGALQTPGANGIVVRTSGTTTTNRSLAAPAAGLTISNNDGVSGNPTFALANDLSALEGLSGTGLAKRTGSDTWTLDTNTYLTGPGSSTDNAIARWDGTGGTAIQNSGVTITDGGEVDLAAGTTSVAPLKFQSGTNLTTATAGSCEYDGKVLYTTPNSNERGVIPAEQFISLTSTYTLTSQTGLQKIFNSTTNGAVTLAGSTSYFFEGLYIVTGFSSSTGTVSLGYGGTATLTSIRTHCMGLKGTVASVGAYSGISFTTATANVVTASNANTEVKLMVNGIVRINAGGTFIPQIGMSVAAAAVVQVDSYFRIYPIGTNTVTNVGNWS